MSSRRGATPHGAGGNKHRCPVCQHLPGPRQTGPIAKQSNPPRTKKAPCTHECHAAKVAA